MDGESKIEIEPWVDYLELEVGPILKYMRYPSFDTDDENLGDESTDDLLEGELDNNDGNIKDEFTDYLLEGELDNDDENIKDKSTHDLFEGELDNNDENIKDESTDDLLEGELDNDNENIKDESTDDLLEGNVNTYDDYKHGNLGSEANNGTDNDVLDEKLDNLNIDNQVDTGSSVVTKKHRSEDVEKAFDESFSEPIGREVKNKQKDTKIHFDTDFEENKLTSTVYIDGIEDEKHESIPADQALQLDATNEILEETQTNFDPADLERQTDIMKLNPDSPTENVELKGESNTMASETQLVTEKLEEKYVKENLDTCSMDLASEIERDSDLFDSQSRHDTPLDDEDAANKFYHSEFSNDEFLDDRENSKAEVEFKMVREHVERQSNENDIGEQMKESVLDVDDDTSEPSEMEISETSTKYASDDHSEPIEEAIKEDGEKLKYDFDDAYYSDSNFLHENNHKQEVKAGRNTITSKKQKDLYLEQSRHAKNDREMLRQDKTKDAYKNRCRDDIAEFQSTRVEKDMVKEPLVGNISSTVQNKTNPLNMQESVAYVERKGDSTERAERAQFTNHKRKNIMKTMEKSQYGREKQLSFDSDTKFDSDYERQTSWYDKSYQRSSDKKYYRPKESSSKDKLQPENQDRRQFENTEYYRTKKHFQPAKLKSIPADLAVWDDRETEYNHTKLYEKPYVHMAGRFNYTNRLPMSQDALANSQHRKAKISRMAKQKKGEIV